MSRIASARGFSLFELLVIMSVAAIVMTAAVPPVLKVAASYRLRAAASEVSAELNTARVLSISRGTQYQIDIDETGLQVLDPLDPDHPPRTRKQLYGGISFDTVPQTPILFYSRGHARPGILQVKNDYGEVFRIEVKASGQITITAADSV